MILSNITIQLIWGWSRDSPGGLRQTAPFDWDGHAGVVIINQN